MENIMTMPANYAVLNSDEMTYVDGCVSASVKWWGVAIRFTARDLEGIAIALGTGSAASWLAAELGAPTVIGGIAFGTIAAGLATAAGVTQLLNWASKGKGITYNMTWAGIGWIS